MTMVVPCGADFQTYIHIIRAALKPIITCYLGFVVLQGVLGFEAIDRK